MVSWRSRFNTTGSRPVEEPLSLFRAGRQPEPHPRLIRLCDPSQNGGVPVRLQAQKATRLLSVAVHFSGENGVPAWEPSQNGCFADLPQAHHQ
jgi:hypothetical protein